MSAAELPLAPRHPAAFSLICVALMWLAPFLYPVHAYPLTTFYQEWGAMLLGLLAASGLLFTRNGQPASVPAIALLPLGLLIVAGVQYGLGKIAYLGQALWLSQYLLWAALLMALGHRLRQIFGLPALVTVLAVTVLTGAVLNTLAGLSQHFHWHTPFSGWITAKVTASVYGNLAQPNHFADYLALGLLSLGWLFSRYRLPLLAVAALAAPMLLVMALSGSRSSWLYLLAMAGWTLWGWRRDAAFRPWGAFSLALLPAFVLVHGLLQLPGLGSDTGITTLSRLYAGSGSVRLVLWHEAVHIFWQFPWLGAGFGQFAWQHFLLAGSGHDLSVNGLYNHAHNLLLQLAAETGLAGVSVLLLTLGRWLWGQRLLSLSPERAWGGGLLLLPAIHSLLEYPLWYAHFLGIAAFLLGMLDTHHRRLSLPGLARLTVAVLLAAGISAQLHWLTGYRQLESLYTQRVAAGDRAGIVRQQQVLLDLNRQVLLQPYAENLLAGMFPVEGEHLAYKLALNQRAMQFLPSGQLAYRLALLQAASGATADAKTQWECALWAYPGEFAAAHQQLAALAEKDPAHFAALLEFALQKFKEYQIAVSAG